MVNQFVEKLTSLVELSPAAIQAIEALTAHPRRYAARKDLIREGDEPGPMFVVLDGWACRYKILPNGSRQIMALLLPGDACDLNVAMLAEMDHGIQAITDTTVAIVSARDMHHLMADHPTVARAMYVAQLIDEGVLRSWIISMGRRSSIERVAHLMCELYLRAHRCEGIKAGDVVLPMSQILLADALGMTPVHVNRMLKELRLAGAMELGRNSLTILDPIKLVRFAGFDENYLHRRTRGAAR